MNKKIKLIFLCIIASVLAVALYLVFNKPKDTKMTGDEITTKYFEKIEDVKGVKISGKADITFSVEGDDMSAEVPIGIDATIISDLKNNAYLDGKATMSFMGMDMDNDIKSYTYVEDDELYTYTYDSTTDNWTYTVTENENTDTDYKEEVKKALDLINIEPEVKKDGDDYKVLYDLSRLDNSIFEYKLSKDSPISDTSMITDLNGAKLDKAEGVVTLIFDKNYMLKNIKSDNVKIYLDMSDVEGAPEDTYVALDLDLTISGYDDIKEEDYTVPANIKENAVNVKDIVMIDDDYYDDFEEDATETDADTEESNDTTESSGAIDIDITSSNSDNGSGELTSDISFEIDGNKLNIPFKYSDLKEAGWAVDFESYGVDDDYELNAYDRITANLEAEADKYDLPLIIGLENRSDNIISISQSNVWSLQIKRSTALDPKVKINDKITWDSSIDDITDVLGSGNIKNYSDGTSITYSYKLDNTTKKIEFYFDTNDLLSEITIYHK